MTSNREDHDAAAVPGDETTSAEGGDSKPLVVEFAVPTDDFLLASTLESVPEIVVEFEQFVPTGSDPLPYLWTTADGRSAFEAAVDSDPTVADASRVAVFGQGTLYELDWADRDDDGLFEWLRASDATVLQSESLDGEWLLKLRMPSRAEVGDLRAHCDRNDIGFRLVRLFSLADPKMGQFNISKKQRESLITALEMGYFEIPRDATLTEVAEAIGISPNSASERLRRAQTNLLNNTVTVGQPTGIGIGTEPE